MAARRLLGSSISALTLGIVAAAGASPTITGQSLTERDLPSAAFHEARREFGSRLAIDVRLDGTLTLEGTVLDYPRLIGRLRQLAAAIPAKKRTKAASTPDVLIRAHRDLPAAAVQKVIDALLDPRVSFPRINFAVGENGSVPHSQLRQGTRFRNILRLAHKAGHNTPPNLRQKMVCKPEFEDTAVIIDCGPGVSYGDAIAAADRVADSGYEGFRLRCALSREQAAAWKAQLDLHKLVALHEPSPIPLSLRFASRTPAFVRGEVSVGLGGTPRLVPELCMPPNDLGRLPTPALIAIAEALKWLAGKQAKNGSWSPTSETPPTRPGQTLSTVGITSIALLAFLFDGNSMRSGQYRGHVKSATQFLRGHIDRDGQAGARGFVGAASDLDRAIATMAFLECYRRSSYRLLHNDTELLVLELAAQPVIDPTARSFRLHALLAGSPHGIAPPKHAISAARDPRLPENPNLAQLGGSLFCEAVSGGAIANDDARITRLLAALQPANTGEPPLALSPLDWLLATRGLRRLNGPSWRQWRAALADRVPAMQHKSPDSGGCWQQAGPNGQAIDSTAATAMFCLALLSDYRPRR